MNLSLKLFFYISVTFFIFSTGWYLSWSEHLIFFKAIAYVFYASLILFFLIRFFLNKKKRLYYFNFNNFFFLRTKNLLK